MSDDLVRRIAALLKSEQRQASNVGRDSASAIAEWRTALLASGKSVSTVTRYVSSVRTLERKYGVNPLALDAGRMIEAGAKMNAALSAMSANAAFSAIRAWAEYTGQSHAVGALKAPTVDPTRKPLPPADDLAKVRDAMRVSKHAHGDAANIRRRDGVIYDLLFEGALRISEVLALDVGDMRCKSADGLHAWSPSVELTHVWVERSKRGKSRLVPLTPTARKSLTNWLALHRPRWCAANAVDPTAVFQTIDGCRLLPDSYRQRLTDYGKAVGVTSLGGKTHTGRRRRITQLIEAKVPPTAIIPFTGHKSTKELEPYIVHNNATAERFWLDGVKK